MNSKTHKFVGSSLTRRIMMLALCFVTVLGANAQKTFIHNKGKSGRDLANGMQQVHEDRHVIYAVPTTSGTDITLSRRTFAFRNYVRWYNYETDNSDANLTVTNAQGTEVETTKGTVYVEVGVPSGWPETDDYRTAAKYSYKTNETVYIACDQSDHYDYNNASTTFREPTISQRIVYEIRPASGMATAMNATSSTKWLEVHKMMAPTGRTLHIGPDYKFTGINSNYYYGSTPTQATEGIVTSGDGWHWKVGSSANQSATVTLNQFITLSHDTEEEVTYELTYKKGSKTYYVAKFIVDYRDDQTVGPYTNVPTTKIANLDPIAKEYFNKTATHTYSITSNGGTTYKTDPLNVDESTFSFFYGADSCTHDGPHYTVYSLMTNTNNIYGVTNTGVGTLSNHVLPEASSDGYLLYVDGSDIVGRVFSLNIPGMTLCPGATMYFSAFIGDVSTNGGGSPDLDFIVTGIKNDGNNTEEVLTTFTTGEFSHSNTATGITSRANNQWQRILFPIKFTSISTFKEFRLVVTNKCNKNNGNDFVIDDIEVFLKPAPLNPLEATSPKTCLDNNTPLVLYTKVDYAQIEGFANSPLYYRWLDEDGNVIDAPYLNKTTDNKGKAAGMITLPATYKQNTLGDSYLKKNSFSDFNTAFYNLNAANGDVAQYAYIYDATADNVSINDEMNSARYSLFIATPIPLGTDGRDDQYTCVISQDLNTLGNSNDCSKSRTIELNSGMSVKSEAAGGAVVKGLSQEACANFAYDLTFLVKYVDLTGKDETATFDCRYKAHWLFATATEVDADFATNGATGLYGANFATIKLAIQHMIVDAKVVAGTTLNAAEQEIYTLLANGGTYPPYVGSNDEKLVNRLRQKGLLVLCSDLADPYKYLAMPLAGEEKMSFTAFPIEKEDPKGPDCLTPQSISLYFPKPDGEHPENEKNVMSFVKYNGETRSTTDPIPAFVSSRPRRVRILEGTQTKNVCVDLTEPLNTYTLSGIELYSIDDNVKITAEDKTTYTITQAIHSAEVIQGSAASVDFSSLDKLLAGHRYTYKVTYKLKNNNTTITVDGESQTKPACGDVDENGIPTRDGEAYITFMIVPKVLTFNPAEADGSWDDDYSFIYTDNANKTYNIAPLPGTSVIVSAGNHELLARTTNKFQEKGDGRKVDVNALPYITWDIDYDPNVCDNIHIESGVALVGQNNVTVGGNWTFDMAVTPNQWTMTAMPLKGIVTGDMFIPNGGEGDLEYTDGKFAVKSITQGSGWAADRTVYSFYNSMYNSQVYHYESDSLYDISSSTWSLATNALTDPLTPGMGWSLGYAPATETTDDAIMRLPKQGTSYNYFRNDTWISDKETFTRAEGFGKPALEFTDGKMTVELHNETVSDVFLLGNPSFAYLDLEKLATENDLNGTFYLSGLDNTTRYNHVTGKVLEDSTWVSTAFAEAALAPLHAVLVKAAKGKSLSLTLTPDMFITKPATAAAGAPRRVAAAMDRKMYITATAAGFESSALLMQGEDASNLVEAEEDAEVFLLDKGKTPFAIYTIADNKALAINQIADLEVVPLGFYSQKSITSEVVRFAGDDRYLSEWDLVDNSTNTREALSDGFTTTLQMANNGTIRYYLEHARSTSSSTTNGVDGGENPFSTFTHDGMLTVFSADDMIDFRLYDTAGRLLAAEKNAGRQQDFNLTKGVYVVRANGKAAKVIVK